MKRIGISAAVLLCSATYLPFTPKLLLVLPRFYCITKTDTTVSAEIQRQLIENRRLFYYPASITRFYKRNNFNPIWITGTNFKRTQDVISMLNCAQRFGLSNFDYHQSELQDDHWGPIVNEPQGISNRMKVRFELMLTDALLNFMNNLHYGKLNPEFPAEKIDSGDIYFKADELLSSALNVADFTSAVLSTRPAIKLYTDMQARLLVLTGRHPAKCDSMPTEELKRISINMERLRWAAFNGSSLIHINIPSYTLTFYRKDTVMLFKVIVGKPANPTPWLNSTIDYFTTAPEWNVPKRILMKEILPRAAVNLNYLRDHNFSVYNRSGSLIPLGKVNIRNIQQNPSAYQVRQSSGCDNSLGLIVFRFPNRYDIYLHDTPEQQLFRKKDRAFSHGCIRVENAEKLAAMLLKNDNNAGAISTMQKAVSTYRNRNFRLHTPVPIYITYLTCDIKDGVMLTYKDIYDLDKRLEMSFYQTSNHDIEAKK